MSGDFEVEKILNKRVTEDGKVQYLVRWEGLTEEDDTWELLENLNCHDLINKYEHEQGTTLEASEAAEYVVEKIHAKRKRHGKIEYLVKWKGYELNSNDWEPKEKLKCPDLIEAFEVEVKSSKAKNAAIRDASNRDPETGIPLDGFEKGYEPERIVGLRDDLTDERVFLMKWRGQDKGSYVLSSRVKELCPQILIRFYEQHMIWSSSYGYNK